MARSVHLSSLKHAFFFRAQHITGIVLMEKHLGITLYLDTDALLTMGFLNIARVTRICHHITLLAAMCLCLILAALSIIFSSTYTLI